MRLFFVWLEYMSSRDIARLDKNVADLVARLAALEAAIGLAPAPVAAAAPAVDVEALVAKLTAKDISRIEQSVSELVARLDAQAAAPAAPEVDVAALTADITAKVLAEVAATFKECRCVPTQTEADEDDEEDADEEADDA